VTVNASMRSEFTNSELEAYLDEAMSPADMADVEAALRGSPQLLERLAAINARRDAGIHSLGEIWRRHRLSCPTREQLGSYLLGVLDEQQANFIQFHLETGGCRLCLANLEDLKRRQAESDTVVEQRRRKYFDSSAGSLWRRSH
jgi:predicted nucleic acid-binding OB-fold protein